MRKVFLLISVLFLAVTANAKEVTISSETANIFRTTVDGCTDDENTIILNDDDAAFDNTGNYIVISHNLTIRAAEGKHPIIKPVVPIQISAGASVKFIGIKFDGSIIGGYDYLIRFNDDNANNELELDNCEFTAVAKACIKVKAAGMKAKSCIIKNCNFHDNSNIAFFNNAGVIETLQIKDSEFSSFTEYPVISNVGSTASLSSLQINACSFHDNTGQIINNESSATISSCTINNSTFQNNSKRGILNQGTITSLQINSSKFSYFTAYPIIDNYNASIGKIKIDGSEFYNNAKYLINGEANSHADSCIVTNCHFHNNARSSIFFAASSVEGTETCDGVIVKNSTFANNDMSASSCSVIEVRNYGSAVASNIEVTVDHCTFFNNSVADGYAAGVRSYKSTKVNISNCIFAHPTPYGRCATYCYGGNVTNCLTYNLTSGTNGHHSGPSLTNNKVGNPYFLSTDPENYDFTLWTTSPARGAGTGDTNLGDPRWTTDPSTHVATVNITADATNSLKAAVNAALPGDVIILAAGTYEESENISLDKEITIKAADGASPVVKPVGEFALGNAADVTIQNIKFDGSDHTASNFIYAVDATSNSLSIDSCEFYSFENAVISATDSKLIKTCTINNCYFYDNTNTCVCLNNTASADLTVTNSTFENINGSSVEAGLVESKTTTGTVLVDHCTFYNCQVHNTDYGTVRVKSPSATVSNCIFAMPTSTGNLRTVYLPDGVAAGTTVTNCIMHNYTKDDGLGIPSRTGLTKTNCNAVDPLFVDAANSDFSIPYNWSTAVFSPAHKAATDNTDLGDKRWFTDEVIPSTDFASPYAFIGAKALVSDQMELDGDNYIHSKASGGSAVWKITATRPYYVQVTLNLLASYAVGHRYTVDIFDSKGVSKGTLSEGSWSNSTGDKVLNGYIYLPAADDYKIVLTNDESGSTTTIKGITLSYAGGDVTEISTSTNTTLALTDALYEGCTRTVDSIGFPSSGTASAWMKWKISTTAGSFYDVTVNFGSSNAHNLTLAFYEDESASPVATVAEGGYTSTKGTGLTVEGRIYLSGGKNYIAKITNATDGSHAKVSNVVFAPVATPVTALPTTSTPVTLDPDDAIKSALAYADGDALYFVPAEKEGYIQDQWAMWKVRAADAGTYLFTMNVTATNMQDYRITVIDSEDNEIAISDWSKSSGAQTLTHYFYLPAGTYFIKVQNTRQWSDGHMVSLVVSLPDDLVVLDDDADAETTNALIEAKFNVADQKIQTLRTIKGGMYNAICLPFTVSSSMAKEVFGTDVELYTLGSATIEDEYILNLELDAASDINNGTPVVIRTSRDIVNPVFAGVQIETTTPDGTYRTNANYVGTFVKTTLTANPDLFFIGANNTLYFPTADVTLKGMRAWFEIHDLPAGVAIRRARIVNGKGEATDIELVNSQETTAKSQKLIINGQLFIIRDGIRYNVMGVKVK